MAAINYKKRRPRRPICWYYTVITCINVLLVGVVLISITPAPSFAVAPHFIHRVPPRIVTQGVPVRIIVPSVGIDLSVQAGNYDASNDTWTIDTLHAFYATLSVPANDNNGTTFIYSHGQDGLFGSLPTIQPGSTALIYTNTGFLFSYTYRSSVQVTPSQTSLFETDSAPTLMLQTCTGDWSQYRALYSFSFTSVSKL